MQELKPTTSTAKTPLFAFCPLTEVEVSKLLLSSHSTTCPLDPIPSHLLQAISPTRLPAPLLTCTVPTTFKHARVTPLLKRPTFNTSLIDSYRPISLPPSIAKMLERVVFNQLASFLSKHNLLDANQSGFRHGHSATLSHWSPANCKIWFQIISSHSDGSICCFWFSWPSSHHWVSQGFHFAALNPISMAGLSRWPGEGRYPQNIN